MPDTNDATSQRRAVELRLSQAYVDAALCESWLALDEKKRALRLAHQQAAAQAQERQMELSQEDMRDG